MQPALLNRRHRGATTVLYGRTINTGIYICIIHDDCEQHRPHEAASVDGVGNAVLLNWNSTYKGLCTTGSRRMVMLALLLLPPHALPTQVMLYSWNTSIPFLVFWVAIPGSGASSYIGLRKSCFGPGLSSYLGLRKIYLRQVTSS